MRNNKTGGRKHFPQTIHLKDENGKLTKKVKTIYHRLLEVEKPKK